MTPAGKLNKRVSIESPRRAEGSLGEITTTWHLVDVVWANIRPLSSNEIMKAKAVEDVSTYRITIRHRCDIDLSWRLTHNGKVFNITSIVPDEYEQDLFINATVHG